MTESVSFQRVSVKGHEVLYQCRAVILCPIYTINVKNIFPELSCQAVGTVLRPVCSSTGDNINLSLPPAAV